MKTTGTRMSKEMRGNTSYRRFTLLNGQPYNLSSIEDEDLEKGPMLKAFGKNLRNLRLEKGLTQEQLGEIANINYKYIGEIERGEKNPTVIVIQRLSTALEAPVCEILTASGCPKIHRELLTELTRLFDGKKEQDQQKALRILQVFFE